MSATLRMLFRARKLSENVVFTGYIYERPIHFSNIHNSLVVIIESDVYATRNMLKDRGYSSLGVLLCEEGRLKTGDNRTYLVRNV